MKKQTFNIPEGQEHLYKGWYFYENYKDIALDYNFKIKYE